MTGLLLYCETIQVYFFGSKKTTNWLAIKKKEAVNQWSHSLFEWQFLRSCSLHVSCFSEIYSNLATTKQNQCFFFFISLSSFYCLCPDVLFFVAVVVFTAPLGLLRQFHSTKSLKWPIVEAAAWGGGRANVWRADGRRDAAGGALDGQTGGGGGGVGGHWRPQCLARLVHSLPPSLFLPRCPATLCLLALWKRLLLLPNVQKRS